jgi:5-carboxyvanillate decarboxylase
MRDIIDGHSHFMPPEVAQHTMFYKVNWSDIDRQLSVMDDLGIAQAVLLYPTSDAHWNMGGWKNVCRVYNNALSAVVKKIPDRFIGAAILPPDDPVAMNEELKRVADLGFRVISFASSYNGVYLDDEKFVKVFEIAQTKKLIIHVHPQILNPIGEERVKDPLLTPVLEYVFDVSVCIGKMLMSGTFLKFPDLKFIFAHYGGVLPLVKERFDNTYLMLRKRGFVKDLGKLPGEYFKNLFFDMSGANSTAALLGALEVTEAGCIIFGSDFPANQNIKRTIETVRNAKISEGQKKKILQNQIFCS